MRTTSPGSAWIDNPGLGHLVHCQPVAMPINHHSRLRIMPAEFLVTYRHRHKLMSVYHSQAASRQRQGCILLDTFKPVRVLPPKTRSIIITSHCYQLATLTQESKHRRSTDIAGMYDIFAVLREFENGRMYTTMGVGQYQNATSRHGYSGRGTTPDLNPHGGRARHRGWHNNKIQQRYQHDC